MTKKITMLTVAVIITAFTVLGQIANPPQPVVVVKDSWLIDLRTAIAVFGVVLAGAWWVRTWMVRVEDRLLLGDKQFKLMEKSLAKLPCLNGRICNYDCGEKVAILSREKTENENDL